MANKRKIANEGKFYNLEFPISIPAVINNPIQLLKLNLDPNHRESLKNIILDLGDEQKHSSNVKADMTSWFMHRNYQEFKQLSIRAEVQAKTITQNAIPTRTNECWGAVYRKGDETKAHNHWGNIWSWCYYLEVPDDSPPIRFIDTFFPESKKTNDFDIYPQEDDILIFPSWFRHCVPKSESDGLRIMVAGNIQNA
tara:strand:+ start:516 stop:1103 length:588 start_codon:yes stop_codon:yes gene_type:complete